MGQTAMYKCRNCGNEFKASDGGGFCFIKFRCVNCDRTKDVDIPEGNVRIQEQDIGKCKYCEGELRGDIGPMCWKCKSRDVEQGDVEIYYD